MLPALCLPPVYVKLVGSEAESKRSVWVWHNLSSIWVRVRVGVRARVRARVRFRVRVRVRVRGRGRGRGRANS